MDPSAMATRPLVPPRFAASLRLAATGPARRPRAPDLGAGEAPGCGSAKAAPDPRLSAHARPGR
jgi:hypothetical protein